MSALIRQTWIRLSNWEYWPFHIVYFPSYFYWFWLSLKARSFFFFSEANPGIKNSGFLMEPKHEIYDILPVGLYPTTIFCKKGTVPEVAISLLLKAGLQYPVILKPDIGQRGMGVALVHDSQQLI